MTTTTPTIWERLPATFRALRHRNFRLFVMGQLISLVGTWMDMVAEQWLVYRLTGSAAMLGMVGFAGQLPSLVLGPIGGTISDRFNRHRLLIGTQTAFMLIAFALAFLTLSGRIRIWELFILAAMMGTVQAFDMPTRQAFIVDMTSKEDLMNAIALNSSMFNASRIVGPAVAGLVVAWVGEGWCFMINAVSFIAVIAGLLMMRVATAPPQPGRESALRQMQEGLRFAAHTPPIRALLVNIGVVSLVGMSYATLMPIFASKILGGGAEQLGILMGASGVGALAGALTLASRRSAKGLGPWVAGACCGFGVSQLFFAASRIYWLSVLILVPLGYCMMVQMGSTNTLIQMMVPDQLRGRVMSLYSTMFMGMLPFGSLMAGAVADRIGAPWTVAIGGFLCIATGTALALQLPKLRPQARALMEPMLAVEAGHPAENAVPG